MTHAEAVPQALTSAQKAFYTREGYLIVRQLFSRHEAEELTRHFMDLHAQKAILAKLYEYNGI